MGHLFARDCLVDRSGLDPTQSDMGAGHRRDRPRETPAVAVEHRQGPQIDRVLPHAPDQDAAERVQISSTVVIDDTFRVAGGPRGVVERDRLPLVLRHHLHELRVAGREKAS
jgi:hypothetical protein